MKLKKLSLRNFKGIASFDLVTNGSNQTSIFGDNATGKTTLVDAQCWLLFDKDSQFKKDFQLKTTDKYGNDLHNLEHSVEGVYTMQDGATLTLKKLFREKYTKKRGSTEAEFTGHETKHWVDGVPAKKNEYTAKVKQYADEELFKLLTNPLYFNELMKWDARRALLLAVCGDVSDTAVIDSNAELSDLPDILNGKNVDDYRKIVVSNRSEINNELKEIPAKIDGANAVLPEKVNTRIDVIVDRITTLQGKADKKRKEAASLGVGGGIADKESQVARIDTRLEQVKAKHQSLHNDVVGGKRDQLNELRQEISTLEMELRKLEQDNQFHQSTIVGLVGSLEKFGKEWQTVNGSTFDETATTCPTCKQSLPAEHIEAAKKQFNVNRAERLREIENKGGEYKGQKEKLEMIVSGNKEKIDATTDVVAEKRQLVEALSMEINKLVEATPDLSEYQEWRELSAEKAALQERIAEQQQGQRGEIDAINAEITEIDRQIKDQQAIISQIETRQKGEERIKEYEDRMKELAEQFEQAEYHLYLLDLFTRTKVNMLDEAINSKFELARFKLFEEQINGGLNPTCITMFNGVPFPSLNQAAKVQVGLDIIKTLSCHYGFKPMIWVDQRESIVRLPDMEQQVISLYVSADDKELRVV